MDIRRTDKADTNMQVIHPWVLRNHNLTALVRHLSSPSLVHPDLRHSKSLIAHKITDRSFRYASPSLLNNLPASFRQPRSSSVTVTTVTPSITSSLFHSRLKTHVTRFTNPSHHRSSPTQRTAPLDFNRIAPTGFAPPPSVLL